MKLVPVKEIPRSVKEVDLNQLPKIYKLCQEMQELCEKEDGIGLSASQVGIDLNLFVIKNKDKTYDYYVNCDYIPTGEVIDSLEGCLSLRNSDGSNRYFVVKRWNTIQLKGKKFSKDDFLLEDISLLIKDSPYNVVFQHEIDHSKGILISDIGKEKNIW